jgi:hypothetical protein
MDTTGFTPELTAMIVRRLEAADDPDNIVADVCEATHLSWDEAEERIQEIQTANAVTITKRQFPLTGGIAFLFFAVGLLCVAYGLYAIVSSILDQGPKDLTSYFSPVIEQGASPIDAFRPAVVPYFQLIVNFIISPVAALVLGIAMITGSLVGMRNTWSILLNR